MPKGAGRTLAEFLPFLLEISKRRRQIIIEYQILFGKRLRVLRKQRDWTQEKLADEAGLDRTYLASIERGERNVSLMNIMKLSHALEVFPGELFKFEKE